MRDLYSTLDDKESAAAPDNVEYYVGVGVKNVSVKFYNSLTEMLLALMKGDIDSIGVPSAVGSYILENNTDLYLKGFNWWRSEVLGAYRFAFRDDSPELVKKFNAEIDSMNNDGTLALLEKRYIKNSRLSPVHFDSFDDAETITVAVTGDLPPIDYIAPDGTPAGFNTAVLAEIGRRLHLNIKTINVDTGARLAALTSGRADP